MRPSSPSDGGPGPGGSGGRSGLDAGGPLAMALRGALIGVAIILPGISGGTAALILGVYREFVEAIRDLRWRGLLPLAAGIAAGGLGGARVIGFLLDRWPTVLAGFLVGLVVASAARLLRRLEPARGGVALVLAGAVLGVLGSLEPGGSGLAEPAAAGLPALFLGGALAAGLMLVPGMSGGTLLIALGLYPAVLQALNRFQLGVLAVFGAGVLVGLRVVSQLAAWFLARHPGATLRVLGGLLLGSSAILWPERFGAAEALALAAGVSLVALAGRR